AAAFAGGVHTVCEMPNTNPPTTSVEALKDKIQRAESVKNVDLRFFFGATEMGHLDALVEVWNTPELRARCSGLKVYFDHSTGTQRAGGDAIDAAFRSCAEHDIPLVALCVDAAVNEEAKNIVTRHIGGEGIALQALHRPPQSESADIEH